MYMYNMYVEPQCMHYHEGTLGAFEVDEFVDFVDTMYERFVNVGPGTHVCDVHVLCMCVRVPGQCTRQYVSWYMYDMYIYMHMYV